MSVIRMNYLSPALNMPAQVNVILPTPRDASAPQRPLPVLYLLHGMGDDFTAWLRKTAVERYALAAGLAVVMPDGGASCYENMAHGERWRDFIADELPRVMSETFPLSSDRAQRFIAGCSMGGFGALKIGLETPERWSAIGSFSAGMVEYEPDSPRVQNMLYCAYDGGIPACNARVKSKLLALNAHELQTRIWHCCGADDILRPNAEKMCAHIRSMPAGSIDYSFELLPGSHDWALWDASVQRFIESLNLPRPEVQLL